MRVLHAAPEHFFTQAGDDIEPSARIISEKVYLAATDSPDNYREITAAEAAALRAARDRALDQERAIAQVEAAARTGFKPAAETD